LIETVFERLNLPHFTCRTVLLSISLKDDFRRVSEVLSLPFHTPKTHLTVLQFRVICVVIFLAVSLFRIV